MPLATEEQPEQLTISAPCNLATSRGKLWCGRQIRSVPAHTGACLARGLLVPGTLL